MVRPGNDLATNHPEISAEWHPAKNGDLTPSQVSRGTARVAWWLGECGHEWEAPIHRRTNMKTGCPFCVPFGRKRILPGFNDLETLHPRVAALWHPTKNEKLANQTAPTSTKSAWWLCPDGHVFKASIISRIMSPTDCQECRLERTSVATIPRLLGEWSPRNDRDASEVPFRSKYRAWWVCEKGHEWQAVVYNRTAGRGCSQCGWSRLSSEVEDELASFVSGLGVSMDRSVRGLIPDWELDIVCPEQGIAIEFNGLYWHSDAHKDSDYHAEKTRRVEALGHQLIHVWEDDWRTRSEVVKRMLARKLGKSTEIRVNARSLEVREVPASESREFLESNHVQGAASGSVRLGLFSGDILHALMIFRSRGDGVWELSRYATSAIVRGGFSKLLKVFKDRHTPDSIVSFSDRGVSDGGLYESQGFHRDGEIAPDYMYVVKDTRVHKFNYRKARFRKDPALEFRDGLTERELADLNGLSRIYDSGKIRWVWSR